MKSDSPAPAGALGCPLLFVYGTLRRGSELHYHLARLGARFLAEGRVAAEIRKRGRYPGARPAARPGKWVRGELFELRHAPRDLRVLDQVEGFFPSAPQRRGFVRAQAEVLLDNRLPRRAWIYWLRARRSKGAAYE
jgi:gamma-glutamylcyclotransferase (GGCT)/AIG2-like uncharacterized protein YtfP